MLRKFIALLVLLAGTGSLLADQAKGTFRFFEGGMVTIDVGKKDANFKLEKGTKVYEGDKLVKPPGEEPYFFQRLAEGSDVTVTYTKDGNKIAVTEFRVKRLVAAPPPVPTVGLRLRSTLEGHRTWLYSVAFSPDGKTVASGGPDGIKLWNTADGKLITDLIGRTCHSLAFTADGKALAAAHNETLTLWDVPGRQQKAGLDRSGADVRCVAASLDGKMLAFGRRDHAIKLWDVAAEKETATLKGHTLPIKALAFSPDGKMLASGSEDRQIKLWDTAAGKETTTLKGHSQVVFALAFSPDGKTLASASGDSTIKLWDVGTNEVRRTFRAPGVISVAFTPDGKFLASAGRVGTINLWDTATGKEAAKWPGNKEVISCVAVSPDGKTLASCGDDKTVKLWDVLDAKQAPFEQHLANGQAALKDKKFAEAVKEFENALKAQPDDPAAAAALKQAQAALAVAVETAKADYDKHMKDGQAALKDKKYADAVKGFEDALKAIPDDAAAAAALKQAQKGDYDQHMRDGQAALKAKKYPDAIKEFGDALKAIPNDMTAAAALKQAQAAVKPAYDKHIKAGQTALTNKKYADAVNEFEEALQLMPNDPAALSHLKLAKKLLDKK